MCTVQLRNLLRTPTVELLLCTLHYFYSFGYGIKASHVFGNLENHYDVLEFEVVVVIVGDYFLKTSSFVIQNELVFLLN